MRAWAWSSGSAALLTMCFCLTARVEAQCDWKGRAAAGMQDFDGGVTSSHFGEITNVICTNSRKIILRANTLENGEEVATHDKIGGDAVLGAWVDYHATFATCSGTWKSGSLFGTTLLGLIDWLDSDTSGLVGAWCSSGDDGGIDICSADGTETTTTTMSAGGLEADAPPGMGLTRSFERPEGRFLAEEWAVLSSDTGEPRVEFASSEAFVHHVEDALDRYYRPGGASSTVVVVETAEHPVNHRFIPTPTVSALDLPVDWSAGGETHEFWFRAEVAEAGGIDRLLMLNSSDRAGNSAVRQALTERLALRYADARRHRTVVFGRATVSPAGRLTLQDSLVVVPQCCCGTGEFLCV